MWARYPCNPAELQLRASRLTGSLVQVKALLREALLRERGRARHVAFAMGLHPRLGEGLDSTPNPDP